MIIHVLFKNSIKSNYKTQVVQPLVTQQSLYPAKIVLRNFLPKTESSGLD